MSLFICDWCERTYETETLLNQHQKTARYCATLQKSPIFKDKKCPHCDKICVYQDLGSHIAECKEKKELFAWMLNDESKIIARQELFDFLQRQIRRNS